MARVTDPSLLAELNGGSVSAPVNLTRPSEPDYSDPAVRDAAVRDIFGGGNKVTDPAVLAELNAVPAAPAPSAPRDEASFLGNMASGIHSGLSARGVGIIQAVYAAAKAAGLDSHPQFEQAMRDAAAKIAEQEKGTGVGGLVGELAGDPLNWIPAGRGSLMLQGAKMGGLSGMLNPTQREDSLTDRAINTATGAVVGGGTGAVLPAAGKLVSTVGDVLGGAAKRGLVAMNNNIDPDTLNLGGVAKYLPESVQDTLRGVKGAFSSKEAAKDIAYNIYAKRLLADGLSPEAVAEKVAQARASGLNPTLAEAVGSRGLFKYERGVAQGTGKGPMRFNQNLVERGTNAIPGQIESRANALIGPEGAVDAAYALAAKEGGATQQALREAATTELPGGGTATKEYELTRRLSQMLADTRKNISERLSELGPITNVEKTALSQAKAILDNAEQRGGTFDALLDAKKQLSNIYIEGADRSIQNQANRHVSMHTSSLDGLLNELAPTAYPKAKQAAQSRLAGRDMRGAVSEAGTGDVAGFLNRIWNSPELKNDFLGKLPDDAARADATRFFDSLGNVSRGFGGTERPVNLDSEFTDTLRGGSTSWVSPLSVLPRAARSIGDTYLPQLREAATDVSWNPDVQRLTERMAADSAPNMFGRQVSNAASNQAAQEMGIAGPYTEGKNQNELSPTANALATMVGGGDYVEKKKKPRKALKVTISKSSDPNIGSDGMPKVNLPGPY